MKERSRIQKSDANTIKTLLKKRLRGSFRVGKNPANTKILIFREREGEDTPVAEVFWETNVGWRAKVLTPPIFTFTDISDFTDDIIRGVKASDGVRENWEQFKSRKNDANWLRYRGSRAFYYLREDGETE